MNIAIFSGEISGDLIGGALAEQLRQIDPEIKLWGVGSSAMRQAGVELVVDSAEWGAISITQAILKVPGMIMKVQPKLRDELQNRRPDVVVLIDFGAFNVRAARYCKRHGIKVVYYFPPGSSRYEGKKCAELANTTDLVIVPFPWAETQYQALGVNAVYVGHPIVERVKSEMSRDVFAGHFGLDPERPLIGILPGSRRHEVEHNLPAMLNASRKIYASVKDAQFVIGVAPSISLEMMRGYLIEHKELLNRVSELWHGALEVEEQLWKRTTQALTPPSNRKLATVEGLVLSEEAWRERLELQKKARKNEEDQGLPPTVLAKGLTYEVMAHSNVLITCSGTATLEAAVFETPMVIMYRGSKLMEIEYYLRGFHKSITHIGLPNILSQSRIVPELIQQEASPDTISKLALEMMNDIDTRNRIKHDLHAVHDMLGEPGASMRAAKLVLGIGRG